MKIKYRKAKPSLPKWFDCCVLCKHRNNCGNCYYSKQYKNKKREAKKGGKVNEIQC